ncbi:MAG TPA: NUDIX domain-containing protein [Acidimicrobiales bacterium]|nr:NUDIX domain-containing protein [Acidimicrobiales bacterium]
MLPLRDAVRAVVLDDLERILLVRFQLTDGGLWATPGGGVEPGETIEATIRRELHEEVGLVNLDLGPVIWERTHEFPVSDDFRGQREKFFLVRTTQFEVKPAFSKEDLAAEGITGARWWTLAEIRESRNERFAPRRLSLFLTHLLKDGPPHAPLDIGV